MTGRKKSWTVEQLKVAVSKSTSYRQVIKKLGLVPAGGNYSQIKKYVKKHKLSIKHFTGKAWNRGMSGIGKPRIPTSDILVKNSDFQSYKLKQRLFNEHLKPKHCELCGWCKRSPEGHLPLEVDHINGDPRDHRLHNLRILCPNCHSLTPNYRYRRGKGKNKPR